MCEIDEHTAKLEFIVEWSDAGVLEMSVSARSGPFAAAIDLVCSIEKMEALAYDLTGFPRDRRDERTFTLGDGHVTSPRGQIRLTFYALDRAGHVGIEVEFTRDSEDRDRAERATIQLTTNPADLDRFATDVRRLSRSPHGQASLRCSPLI